MTLLHFPGPALTGEGIVLRPWRAADLDDVVEGTQDPLVPWFTAVPENNTRANAEEYFTGQEAKRLADEELVLAIADAETDRFLGPVSIFRFDWKAREGEIGYWLAPWGRGRGAATQAVSLLSDWAFSVLPIDELQLRIDDDNIASLNVGARAGFTRADSTPLALEEHKGEQRRIVTLTRQR